MRKVAILLLLLLASKSFAFLLSRHLWTYKTGSIVEGLTFSDDGKLGVVSYDHCIYILDQKGNLIIKKCGNNAMLGASYCCDKFGFVNEDGNAYIYDLKNGTWKKVYVGSDHAQTITMLQDGFLAGSFNDKLAYFTFDGFKGWDVEVDISGAPTVYGEYVYVPGYSTPSYCTYCKGALIILNISSGERVRIITFSENVNSAQVCDHYLALGTAHHVYLYNISNPLSPKLLWSVGGIASSCTWDVCGGAIDIAFSPDCKYILSADNNDHKIHIFDIKGNQVLERKFESHVWSVAWWRDRIAIGLYNGKVYVLKIKGYIPSIATACPCTTTVTTTTTLTTTVTKTITRTTTITYTIAITQK
ncbi:hypothetical protein IPA_06735 [Ignicoccus pacificus DSM 13166]|uniref:Uncharacterized protein n=1 Tax=Ignicoccus pacificus DSM 13166 TaxID=940294 RepID=A0A977KCI7_9CREN|nr:hypothetical protein IPA_06735 [Ignicoccus pacificus DSM 13166]